MIIGLVGICSGCWDCELVQLWNTGRTYWGVAWCTATVGIPTSTSTSSTNVDYERSSMPTLCTAKCYLDLFSSLVDELEKKHQAFSSFSSFKCHHYRVLSGWHWKLVTASAVAMFGWQPPASLATALARRCQPSNPWPGELPPTQVFLFSHIRWRLFLRSIVIIYL